MRDDLPEDLTPKNGPWRGILYGLGFMVMVGIAVFLGLWGWNGMT